MFRTLNIPMKMAQSSSSSVKLWTTMVVFSLAMANVKETYARTADVDTSCVVNCGSFPSLCENGGTCQVRYNCQNGRCTCDGLACDCPENYLGVCCEKPKTVTP